MNKSDTEYWFVSSVAMLIRHLNLLRRMDACSIRRPMAPKTRAHLPLANPAKLLHNNYLS